MLRFEDKIIRTIRNEKLVKLKREYFTFTSPTVITISTGDFFLMIFLMVKY